MRVVGMLSGTSMDGIDVAVADLRWEGDSIVLRPLADAEHAWADGLRERLLAVLPPNRTTAGELCELDTLIGQQLASVASSYEAELVVSHGQTVFHWVDGPRALGTLQLGQPAWIAEAVGVPVVSDLRSRDIAAGGQGAPLASTLDVLWLRGSGTPTAALNLGGIANVTLVDAEPPIAFDTGPANCLLDLAAERVTDGRQACDRDGRLAREGRVREDLLEVLMSEPYLALPPPKSTGRELFHGAFLDAALARVPEVEDTDLLATLTAYTAETVARACRDHGVERVVASGGGVHNPALVAALRDRVGDVTTSDELGLPSGAKEAYLFALLGFLTWYSVPGVLAGATGGRVPRVLGSITPGNAPLRLPPPGSRPERLIVERTS